MREILFRGQTRKYGEKVRMGDGKKLPGHWVYGGVLQGAGSHSIIYGGENVNDPSEDLDKWCVHTDTLGQFTGKTDKNGKKIFEGDMFHLDDEIIAVVIFKDGCFRLEEYGLCGAWTESGFDECGGGWGVIECDPIDWYTIRDMEIIGNIHDNPELLEVPNGQA
jgi:uncharacterized phage protein (TIGR01671 family)